MSYDPISAPEDEFPLCSDNEASPLEPRTRGTTAMQLSTNVLRRITLNLKMSSPGFLHDGLVEAGKTLASVVVPLTDSDEAAFMRTIAENADNAKTPTRVQYFSILRTNLPPMVPLLPFLRQVCEKTLEIHFSPAGLVSFGLKLGSGLDVASGDLIAEAAALALWPQQQLGWEHNETNDNVVFASSVSEIDGMNCGISQAGCQAIAEGVLAPRKNVDDVWVFNECLRGLLLGGNPHLGDAGASAIAAALKPKLELYKPLIFNKTLTVLDLSKCGIGPQGAVAIAESLKMVAKRDGSWIFPSNLRALNLSGNGIEERGALAIANLLLGPKLNKKNKEWMFNPSLAVIDLSDQFSGMGEKVAKAFAEALKPRPVTPRPGGEGGSTTQTYSVNVALVELNLSGHAFRDVHVELLKNSLDPLQNGSGGTVGASVRLVLEYPRLSVKSENKTVTDNHGNDEELVLPITSDYMTHFRPLTHWHWRAWNAPYSTSRDNPSVAPENNTPRPGGHLAGAGALVELVKMPSFGFAIRSTLLHHVEGKDIFFSNKPDSISMDGLPDFIVKDITCPICSEVFIDPHFVNGCGHTFCFHCISRWFTNPQQHLIQCPICRHRPLLSNFQPISAAITPANTTRGLIERHVLPHLSSDELNERRELGRERTKAQLEDRRVAAARVASRDV